MKSRKRKRGRPKLLKPTARFQITLHTEVADYIRQLGNGSLSAGINYLHIVHCIEILKDRREHAGPKTGRRPRKVSP